MMAWEYLEEPINENESDHENCYSPNNEENSQKNLAEEEEANDEFSVSSSSTDYDCLEQERIQDNILLLGNMKTKTQCIRPRNWKEIPRRLQVKDHLITLK